MESHLVFCRGGSSRDEYNTYYLSFLVLGILELPPRLYPSQYFGNKEIYVLLCMAVLLLFTLGALSQTEKKL